MLIGATGPALMMDVVGNNVNGFRWGLLGMMTIVAATGWVDCDDVNMRSMRNVM